MRKLSRLKKLLNNLRAISIILTLVIIALTTSLVDRIDNNKIDFIFYMDSIINIVFIFTFVYIFIKISKITKYVMYM